MSARQPTSLSVFQRPTRRLNADGVTADRVREFIEKHGERAGTSMLHNGVTPDRADELIALGVPARNDALRAMLDVDDDTVVEWLTELHENEELRDLAGRDGWRHIGGWATAGLNPGVVSLYQGCGVDPGSVRELIELRVGAPAAAEYAAVSTLNPEVVGDLLAHNARVEKTHPSLVISAEKAKSYGRNFTAAELAELSVMDVPAKAARSVKASDKSLTAEQLLKLTRAGVTTGSDYRSWRDVVSPRSGYLGAAVYGFASDVTDPHERILLAASSGVPVDAVARFTSLRVDEPREWQRLHRAGIDDLTPYLASGDIGRADSLSFDLGAAGSRTTRYSDGLAAFVEAGGTPELHTRMLRAGIPTSVQARYVGESDLWAAGAEYRETIIENETARAKRWGGSTSSKPWTWDEMSYLAG